MIYFDDNATSPLRPAVIAEVQRLLERHHLYGNPASVHGFGRAARRILEESREEVASYAGIQPSDVIFTSGATESNAMALLGHKGAVLFSGLEHEAVQQSVPKDAERINATPYGVIDLAHLECALKARQGDAHPPLVAVILAHNETGVCQPLDEVAALCERYGAFFHVDGVQGVSRLPQTVIKDIIKTCTTFALSGHKIGALTGVGALLLGGRAKQIVRGVKYVQHPLIQGGGQERGYRGGTENVIGILSLGVAMKEAALEHTAQAWERIKNMRDSMEKRIKDYAPDAHIVGDQAPRLPNTSMIIMPQVKNSLQMMLFDQKGIAVSTGSACSSGKVKESRALAAMGVAFDLSSCAVRVSMSPFTSWDDVTCMVNAWCEIYTKQRALPKAQSISI